MRSLAFISSIALLCLCIGPLPAAALASDPGQECIILVQSTPALLARQADTLHRLIDLMPAQWRLGMGFCGQTSLLRPAPLTLERRADLHAALQLATDNSLCNERDWQRLTMQAAEELANRAARETDAHLIMIQQSGDTAVDWSYQSEVIRAARIMVTVLTEQPNGSLHPLVQQVSGQQRPLDGDYLSVLLQQLGLGAGWLTQAVFSRDRSVSTHSFFLDDAVDGFILLVEHAPSEAVTLISPAAEPWSVADTEGEYLTAAGYTCWHVNKQQAADNSWVGDWQLTIPGQANASLWLLDRVRLEGAVVWEPAGRVVTASIWRGGARIRPDAASSGMVALRDRNRNGLIMLNDVGLNGDRVAGDGVFSAWLPDFVHPIAGAATLEVQGYVYRQASLFVPGAAKQVLQPASRRPILPLAVAAMAAGGLGLIAMLPVSSSEWRLQHRSSTGYLRRISLGRRAIYAGSGQGCVIRLSANSGRRHLRFSLAGQAEVKLQVLQAEPPTVVNGRRIFLRAELTHGDTVQVENERVIVEHLPYLRLGRKRSVTPGRDPAADGKSNQ
ncbi:MAG: FHA domain-containing protein [Bacillota bacterium]|jgi:hypothetical protein